MHAKKIVTQTIFFVKLNFVTQYSEMINKRKFRFSKMCQLFRDYDGGDPNA